MYKVVKALNKNFYMIVESMSKYLFCDNTQNQPNHFFVLLTYVAMQWRDLNLRIDNFKDFGETE